MSYLVLARKWRPQSFNDVVGQEHVTRTLQNAIKSGRVAHAYLFTGARGVGKTSAARILAKALNCASGPTPQPCNSCELCREISGGSSIDVFEIDGASNTSVDDVRELRENIKFPPIKGRYRIYIIDEVHMLSTSAFNALLKTLEEPPAHVVFIFATTEVQKIPVTILSRCQEFDFKRIPAHLIQERLKSIAGNEGIKISDKGLHIIAREADGGMRDAQSILDQVISFSGEDVSDDDVAKILGIVDRDILMDVMRSVQEKNPAGCVSAVERIYDNGYDIRLFCRNLLEYIRNLTVIKYVASPSQAVDLMESEFNEMKRLSEGFSGDELQQLFAILTKGEEELKRSSTPRLSLEMTLMKMATIRPLIPISELIDMVKGLGGAEPTVNPSRAIIPPKTTRDMGTEKLPVTSLKKVEEAQEPQTTSTAIEMEEPGDVWNGFLMHLQKKKPSLASIVGHSRLLGLGETEVRLAFEKGSFYLESIEEKENKTALTGLIREYLGKGDFKVSISPAEPQAGNKERVEKSGQPQSHPIVGEAVKIFGGKVISRGSELK